MAEDGVLVQLFGWITGGETNQQWYPRSAVEGWNIYTSHEDMNYSYEYTLRHIAEAVREKEKQEQVG